MRDSITRGQGRAEHIYTEAKSIHSRRIHGLDDDPLCNRIPHPCEDLITCTYVCAYRRTSRASKLYFRARAHVCVHNRHVTACIWRVHDWNRIPCACGLTRCFTLKNCRAASWKKTTALFRFTFAREISFYFSLLLPFLAFPLFLSLLLPLPTFLPHLFCCEKQRDMSERLDELKIILPKAIWCLPLSLLPLSAISLDLFSSAVVKKIVKKEREKSCSRNGLQSSLVRYLSTSRQSLFL